MFRGTAEQLGAFTEQDLIERADTVRSDPNLGPRIVEVARSLERQFSPPAEVEEKLYGFGFPSPRDDERMAEFHAADWHRRAALVREFDDVRFQQLARRIVYFENPGLLPATEAAKMAEAIAGRLRDDGERP